jgi:hypothetical protein
MRKKSYGATNLCRDIITPKFVIENPVGRNLTSFLKMVL